ncbi:hypothetical protein FRB91_009176 [Serendipita sp. 411]|nr:hypothetical protein FRB91_009176 [Serendipita sp. 411]
MATSSRPPKGRKPFNDNNSPVQGSRGGRPPAWRASGGSNYANATRQNTQFPPLSGGQQPREAGYDPKLLSTLATAKGASVIITLKTGARHEGIVVGIISEGDAAGVTLKDCRDLSNPSSTVRESFVVPASNIQSWSPRASNGTDSFRTDTDISTTNNSSTTRERDLQPWQQPEGTDMANRLAALQGDEATFGPSGGYSGAPWDQFEANEQLYGVTTRFDETQYTTKLDRNAPGFEERERRAQKIAEEILSGTTSNTHVAEERVMNGTGNSTGEEEKYSAVVRAPGAYVPPGARRNGTAVSPQATANPAAAASPTSASAGPQQSTNPPAAVTAQATAPTTNGTTLPGATLGGTGEEAAVATSGEGLVANFRDFVTNEKQRLAQRKQAMVKTDMDKRKADLLKFSKNFKLSKPIPEDLVPILAKDEEKQKAIREKSIAEAKQARESVTTGVPTVNSTAKSSPQDQNAKPAVKAPAPAEPTKKSKTPMFIQAIPPFDKSKLRKTVPASTQGGTPPAAPQSTSTPTSGPPAAAPQAVPSSPSTAQANTKLNANASVFRPNANAPPFKPISPSGTPATKPKETIKEPPAVVSPPNPFYGARVPTKKGVSVHIKEDFNPFRHTKVVDASQISSIWPYNGKRFAALHVMLPGIHPAPGVNMPVPFIPGPPAPPHEEDPSAQPIPGQRPMPPQQQPPQQPQQQPPQQPPPGYPVMYYPQYPPYSPAPHGQQPMMMPPASPYMHGHYMQAMPYPPPPHMAPNAAMYGHPPPGMPGVPQTPHYMPHAPYGAATSPPPTGTPRGPGPIPPGQMPQHTYYHPSPQLTHAMPYPMMMPPPQPGPPHYDPAQGPPPVPPQQAPMGH